MAIKLKDHINYEIENWITEEEAEELFIAAGCERLENADSNKES